MSKKKGEGREERVSRLGRSEEKEGREGGVRRGGKE